MTRASVLDVLQHDHVRTARAKGVAPRRILRRHVLRNALMPGDHRARAADGHAARRHGAGRVSSSTGRASRALVAAVDARDYPDVVGIVLTISVLFVVLNLLVDLLYAALDPRITLGDEDGPRAQTPCPAARPGRWLIALLAPVLPLPDPSAMTCRTACRPLVRPIRWGATNLGATCSPACWGARASLAVALGSAPIAA